jgi:membrane-bound serine protease (ClpP class)
VEIVWIICGIAVALLLIELLAPTGGLLAVLGAAGFAVAGIFALSEDGTDSTVIGAALITAGVISLVAALVIGKKVLRAHRDEPVRTGWEELIGRDDAVVREQLDPVGQIWVEGSLWRARAGGDGPVPVGNRVRVESVDGLTLVVTPLGGASDEGERGG